MKLPEEKRQEYQRYLENLHYEASMAHTYEAIKEEIEQKVRREVQKELAMATARKMLAKGYAIVDICELTGLTADEVAALS